MLVPQMLRRLKPNAKIGYFHHVPFPSSEVFRIIPWRAQLLQGLLGADVVGFHTLGYLRHMQRCAELFCDIEVSGGDTVMFQGRTVKIAKFPIGVDDSAWRSLATTPEVVSRVAQIRAECDNRRIILSVDRLDYTKGTFLPKKKKQEMFFTESLRFEKKTKNRFNASSACDGTTFQIT